MVGVPRGKRCEMCKERRRKCDGKTPSCSLCQRLKCPCVRPGKQFVFVGSRHDLPAGGDRTAQDSSNSSSSTDDDDVEQVKPSHSSQSDLSVISYSPSPSDPTSQLTQRLAWTLNERSNLNYSLISTFGTYLEELPRYIGHCPALDAAVRVVVSGYSSFRLSNENLNLVVAKEYSQALLLLRSDVAAFSGDGLPLIIAAVLLLALFECIDGSIKTGWMAHAGGASRLIRSPHFRPHESALSSRVLQSTRGTLVLEALMTEESFDDSTQLWHDAVEVPSDETPLQKECYRYLAMLPALRKKAKKALMNYQEAMTSSEWDETFLEIQTIAYNFQPVYEALLKELDDRIMSCTSKGTESPQKSFNKDPKALRTLKFCFPAMIIQVLLHAWLSYHDPSSTPVMKQAAQRVCGYIPLGMQFRPLGSAHLTMPLRIAYIGVTADIQRVWIKDQINTIHQDIQGSRAHLVTFKELDWWADTVSLKCLSPTTMPWAIVARDPLNSKPEALKTWSAAREALTGPSDDILLDDRHPGPTGDFRNYSVLAEVLERQAANE